jgi:hypothetical protein
VSFSGPTKLFPLWPSEPFESLEKARDGLFDL